MKFSEVREAIFWEVSLLRDDLYGARPAQALTDVLGFAKGDIGVDKQNQIDIEITKKYLDQVMAAALAARESLSQYASAE